MKLTFRLKGGKGSGHFGHRGRPGHQGGALPDNKQVISIPYEPDESAVLLARKAAEMEIDELSRKVGYKGLVPKVLTQLPKFVAESKVRIRTSPEDILKILEDGRLKSQFETGDSNGAYKPEWRRQAEADGLGVPEDLEDSQRPIYGYLLHDELPQANAYIEAYGSVIICLKDDIKTRVTVTLGDSLAGFDNGVAVGTPMLDFGKESINYELANYIEAKYHGESHAYSYTEAQIHGGVKLEDIDHVEFDVQDFKSAIVLSHFDMNEFIQKFKDKGIKVIEDPEGTLVSKKELKVVRLKGGPGSGHRDHKGIPGHRGGSLPDDANSSSIAEISKSDMLNGIADENISGRDFTRKVGKIIAEKWNPSDKTLSILNAEEKTGNLSKEQIAGMYLAQWTGSSGGPIPSVMIEAAAESHGIKLQNSIVDSEISTWMNNNPTVKKDIQDLGNIIYENTQEWLKSKGISKVILYRKGTAKDSEKSVTSWSTEYGAFISTDESRISLEATIPVKHIFSLANTGFGNVEEREAVVIGDVSEFVHKSNAGISNSDWGELPVGVDATDSSSYDAPWLIEHKVYIDNNVPDWASEARDRYVVNDERTLKNNSALRAGKTLTSNWLKDMDKLAKTTTFVKDSLVYRGAVLSQEYVKALIDNKGFTDLAFMSVSSHRDLAETYAEIRARDQGTEGKQIVIFTLKAPAGSTFARMDPSEYVFPRGKQVTVTGVRYPKAGNEFRKRFPNSPAALEIYGELK